MRIERFGRTQGRTDGPQASCVIECPCPWRAVHQDVRRQGGIMTVKRMDNVGIVVEDLDAAIEFFTELGLALEGRAPIEGDWADGVTGLRDMRVEIAMMRTPDGHSRLEMSRFLAPPVV